MAALSLSPVAAPPSPSTAEKQHELQRRLARRNQLRLGPILPGAAGDAALAACLAAEAEDRRLEETFVAGERAAVREALPRFWSVPGRGGPVDQIGDARARTATAGWPRQVGGDAGRDQAVSASAAWSPGWNASRFVRWFEDLRETGPGQGDPLFPWLARDCTSQEMRWFLGQEVAGEAGFEDLLALTQLKMPVQVKLEMARNFWDEMGRGRQSAMHGPMLDRLSDALSVRLPIADTIWEGLALGNLMVALAWNRHYAYQAIGALGVIELTAPGRAKYVNAGLQRLGVTGELRRYFAVHATLDVKHSVAWNSEVLLPLVAADPAVATAIAEGALMRLRAGARCFAAYRARFCLPTPATAPSPFTASRATAEVPRRLS